MGARLGKREVLQQKMWPIIIFQNNIMQASTGV
jgi:hypothetical protein